jgi:hypothetical protein
LDNVNNPTIAAVLEISTQIDLAITIFFTIETSMKIISQGFILDKGTYLRDSWSILDFIIVASSLIDYSLTNINLSFVKMFRLLRALRPLRFVSRNKNMKVIVAALVESVSGIANVILIILIIWIIFAILGIIVLKDKLYYCDIDLLDLAT